MVNGKMKYLGYFNSKESAARAIEEAKRKYLGGAADPAESDQVN